MKGFAKGERALTGLLCRAAPYERDQIGMAPLAGEVGLGHPDTLGRDVVVGRGVGVIDQRRVLARQQQAGVDRRLDRLERAAAGRQKQRAWQETERNRA